MDTHSPGERVERGHHDNTALNIPFTQSKYPGSFVNICSSDSKDTRGSMVQQASQTATARNHGNYDPISMDSDDNYLRWRGTGGSLSLPHSSPGDQRIKSEKDMDFDDMDSGTSSHSPNVTYSPGDNHSPGGFSPHGGDTGQMVHSDNSTDYNRKKKGSGLAGKSIEEEVCLICGDRASGYHYNALSCEGCKGFFRRSITRGSTYQCKYGGNCEMDMWMRRRCQSCRLRRCREVGMKEECLLSDDQCRARDARRKARQRVQKVNTTSAEAESPTAIDVQHHSPDSNTSEQTVAAIVPHCTDEQEPALNPLECITPEHRELIENIVYSQDKYELPNDEDIKNISNVRISDVGRPKEMSQSIYKMVAEMTILTTQLVVEFAKHLPGFTTLNRDDQIVLLKGSASEVMVLRTARRYDLESGMVILGNGMPMSKESMQMAGLHDYMEKLFVFCRRMALLGVDNAEYSLITALCILTERPGLNNPRQIEKLHDMYLFTLIDYINYRRARGSNFLAKLLMKFTELQTVSQIHAKSLYNLRLEKVSLPPLLSEYFDVMD